VALGENEVWRGGFVVDAATGAWVTTTSTTDARWWGGFLRDSDGRLVVTSSPGGQANN
jgi:hypothetical protein